jgi:hypothetical protein
MSAGAIVEMSTFLEGVDVGGGVKRRLKDDKIDAGLHTLSIVQRQCIPHRLKPNRLGRGITACRKDLTWIA